MLARVSRGGAKNLGVFEQPGANRRASRKLEAMHPQPAAVHRAKRPSLGAMTHEPNDEGAREKCDNEINRNSHEAKIGRCGRPVNKKKRGARKDAPSGAANAVLFTAVDLVRVEMKSACGDTDLDGHVLRAIVGDHRAPAYRRCLSRLSNRDDRVIHGPD